MIATVFYNEATDEQGRSVCGFGRGYQPGHPMRRAVTLVVPGPAARGAISHSRDADARDVAEQVFAMLNRGSGREAPELDALGLRSMSVGDVVIVNTSTREWVDSGIAYSCEAAGWTKQLPKRVLLDAGRTVQS